MKRLLHGLERKIEAVEGTPVVLLIIGLIGVVMHFAHLGGLHIPISPTVENLVLLLSLLCIGIGLGQLKLAALSNKLADEVRGTTHGFVVEADSVWPTLAMLVANAKDRIRATHLTTGENSDQYLDALSKQLRQGISYQVIVGYGADGEDSARQLATARLERFKGSGCDSKNYHAKYIGVVWGLDLLIVDDRHLFLGFPVKLNETDIKSGVVFWNKPDLVNKVSDWYDTHLWEVARR